MLAEAIDDISPAVRANAACNDLEGSLTGVFFSEELQDIAAAQPSAPPARWRSSASRAPSSATSPGACGAVRCSSTGRSSPPSAGEAVPPRTPARRTSCRRSRCRCTSRSTSARPERALTAHSPGRDRCLVPVPPAGRAARSPSGHRRAGPIGGRRGTPPAPTPTGPTDPPRSPDERSSNQTLVRWPTAKGTREGPEGPGGNGTTGRLGPAHPHGYRRSRPLRAFAPWTPPPSHPTTGPPWPVRAGSTGACCGPRRWPWWCWPSPRSWPSPPATAARRPATCSRSTRTAPSPSTTASPAATSPARPCLPSPTRPSTVPRCRSRTGGKPLLINFWSSTCAPCIKEMPDLEQSYQANRDSLGFLGLQVSERAEFGLRMIEQTGITYPTGRDSSAEVFRAFGGVGPPPHRARAGRRHHRLRALRCPHGGRAPAGDRREPGQLGEPLTRLRLRRRDGGHLQPVRVRHAARLPVVLPRARGRRARRRPRHRPGRGAGAEGRRGDDRRLRGRVRGARHPARAGAQPGGRPPAVAHHRARHRARRPRHLHARRAHHHRAPARS